MTDPTTPRQYNEPPPSVQAVPEARTGAGTPVSIALTITNLANEPRVIALATLGVDADWLPRPSRSRPVMPGESIVADLTLSPTVGTVPARYPLAVAVQALDPVEQRATSVTAVSELVLIVDAPGQLDVAVEPPTITGVFGKRMRVVLRNSGMQPEHVRIEVRAPQSMELHLASDSVQVAPGQAVAIGGRAKAARVHFWGGKRRNTYTVTARSAGAPRHVEAAFTARPVLGPFGTKLGLVMMVLALWVAAAAVFIPKLANHVRNNEAGSTSTQTTTSTAPAKGGGNGKNGGGGNGGKNGGGSNGGGKNGGGKNGGGATDAVTAAARFIQLNGTVTGPSPSGVKVAIAPTSLVDEAAEGARHVPASPDSASAGKISEASLLLTAPRVVSKSQSVTTHADGTWGFAKVHKPGYYLLTLSKPGYQTVKYVIDSSSAVATQPLKVALVPGNGKLTGTVSGPHGAVGGAQVTITDGTNTLTTSSNSTTSVGQWSVDGLSTPDSYLVSVTKNGMSTESQLVDLPAGGHAAVALTLHVGVASMSGLVQSTDSLGKTHGLGGVTVTASDGTATRTATTLTTGNLKGTYTLADLPPGKYSVTFKAAGYLTQTKQKVIPKGASGVTVPAMLNSSSAIVTGSVHGTGIGAIVGAGLMMTSGKNSYKITSRAGGKFRFNGVAPGVYTISAEFFGRTTSYHTVKAVVGKKTPPVHFLLGAESVTNTSTITGFVGNATSSGGTLGCNADKTLGCTVFFALVDSTGAVVNTSLKGAAPFVERTSADAATGGPTSYTLSAKEGLAPGLYRLTIGSLGFLPATIAVRVPLDAPLVAPAVNLFPANAISGTVDALGDITQDGAGNTYTNCAWAVPTGSKAPTTCPDAAHEPDQSDCTNQGQPTAVSSDLNGDNYAIKGLCNGRYDVYFVITNPAYHAPAKPGTETVNDGQTLDYSPHIPRYGRVVLSFKQADDTTGDVTDKTGAFAVQAACDPSSAPDISPTSTGTDGTIAVWGAIAGKVSCQVNTVGTDELDGQISNVSVSDDTDTAATITLSHQLNTIVGEVVTHYAEGPHAVPDTAVTITGITKYDGTTPVPGSVTVTTNAQGCFAILQPNTTLDTNLVPPECGTLDTSTGGPIGTLSLVNRAVTVDIADSPATEKFSGPITLAGATTPLNTFTVVPIPADTSGLSILPVPSTLDITGATVKVTATQADGSGAITSAVGAATGAGDGSRGINWTDGNVTVPNMAWPGTYGVAITLPGTHDVTSTIDCPPASAGTPKPECVVDPSGPPLAVVAFGALSGTINGYDLGVDPGMNSPTALSGATVTLTCVAAGTGTYADPCPATNPDPVKTNFSGQYSFTGTTAHYFLPLASWKLTVSYPGYDTTITAPFDVNPGDNSQDVKVDALGLVSGTITGSGAATPGGPVTTLAPVGGAKIVAHCNLATAGTPCPLSDVTVNTNPSGDYTMPSNGGYGLPIGDWTFTVTASGYETTSFPVAVGSGTNDTSADDFSIPAYGTLSGIVKGEDAGGGDLSVIAGAQVEAKCTDGCTGSDQTDITVTSDGSGHYSIPSSGGGFVLDPAGTWDITVTATHYSTTTLSNQTFVSGANALTLHAQAWGTLSGQVSGVQDAIPTDLGAVSGATVTAKCVSLTNSADGTCPSDLQAGTNPSGVYSFPSSGTDYPLPPGQWTLSVSAPGYVTTDFGPFTITSGPNNQPLALPALAGISGTVVGTTDGSGGGTTGTGSLGAVTGATVSLGCNTTTRTDCPTMPPAVTTGSDGAFSFGKVNGLFTLPPGEYQLTVHAPGYADPNPQPISITAGHGANVIKVDLNALGTLTGKITDQLGTPVNGANVVLTACEDGMGAHEGDGACATTAVGSPTTSDPSGIYTISGPGGVYSLVPGLYELDVTGAAYSEYTIVVDVHSGANTRPVQLNQLGAITGTVKDGSSTLVTGASVTAQLCSDGAPGDTTCTTSGTAIPTTTDNSGHFVITSSGSTSLTPGANYLLTVTAPGYVTWTQVIHVMAGTNNLDTNGHGPINLIALGAISGKVTGQPGGGLVAGASIVATACTDTSASPGVGSTCATDGSSQTDSTTSNASGLYTVGAPGGANFFKPGSYLLTASAAGYQNYTAVVAVATGTTQNTGVAMDAVAGMSGHVTGLLDKPPAAGSSAPPQFVQNLSGALVTAHCVTPATGSCPADPAPVTTDTNGNYTFAPAGGLTPGTWTVSVSDFGYQTTSYKDSGGSSDITVGTGPNPGNDVQLPVNQVRQQIEVDVDGHPTAQVKLVLTRSDESSETDTLTGPAGADGTTKIFTTDKLVPATYNVAVTGSGPLADSILPTTATISIAMSATDNAVSTGVAKIPVSAIKTSVTGTVQSLGDTFGTAKNLQGVTVELGTMSGSPAAFTPADNLTGDPLTATTDVNGAFTVTGVPNGTYYARANNTAANDGIDFDKLVTTSSVTAAYGQTVTFGTLSLPRLLHQVTVTVTAPTGDPVNTPTATFTSSDYTGVSLPVTGSSMSYGVQLPAGCWKVALAGHPDISLSSTNACPANGFTVPSGGTGAVAASYQVNEFKLSVTGAATAIAPDATTGVSATVSVKLAGAVVAGPMNLTLNGSTATTFWLTPHTYSVHVDASPSGAWTVTDNDQAVDMSSSAGSASFHIAEAGATINVDHLPSGFAGNSVSVSAAGPTGAATPAACTDPHGAGTCSFTGLPSGSWVVTASWTDTSGSPTVPHTQTQTVAVTAGDTESTTSGGWTGS